MNTLYPNLILQGCNVKSALNRFLGDDELYISCLSEFAEDPNFEELKKTVKSNNMDDIFDYAHALKGVSGNLGLTPIYESTSDLVQAIRDKEYDKISEIADIIFKNFDEFKSIMSQQ